MKKETQKRGGIVEDESKKKATAQVRIRTRRRKKKRGAGIMLIIIAFVAVMVGGTAVFKAFIETKPVFKIISGWDGSGIRITMKAEAVPLTYSPIMKDDEMVYPISFIKDYIDETIFWDEAANKLTITTADKVIRMSTDDLNYFVNNEPMTLNLPVYNIDGIVYMPESMMKELYYVSCNFNEESQIVSVDFNTEETVTGDLAKKTAVYFEANKKSSVLERLDKSETVTAFGTEGDFTKIRTSKGIPGYILSKNIAATSSQKPIEIAKTQTREPWKPINGKINMIWDQVFKPGQSGNADRKVAIDGMDVVSPTWFGIADAEGQISNIADKSYVDWAHSEGYQVWALFSNSFDSELTHETLNSTDKRESMIRQILAFVSLYNLDGINIDFESIAEEDGEFYVQFIREITPLLKQQGVTVSVDMYIPSPWTRHYNMKAVGEVVDYVCVMAYDEHYATSKVSGSVASLGWVEDAIKESVTLVAPEKIILGMPLYTRLWEEKTQDGVVEVSAKAIGMENSYKNLNENGAQIVYDEASGQNYGEYEKDGAVYKIWLEDEQSIEKRLQIIDTYGLGGAASWKRGFEKDSIWPLIERYLKK